MKETLHYDEMEDRLTVNTSYDAQPNLDENKRIRNSVSSKSDIQYSGSFVHAAKHDEGDVVRLINMGYNVLSPDPEEVRRALVYIQQNENHLLLVNGNPFIKGQRVKWV